MEGWGPELAILLGIVEGLTEFLPVSSTGHLILVGHLLGFTGEIASSVEISIQLGAILSILVYERDKISTLLSEAAREQKQLRDMVHANRGKEHLPSGEPWFVLLARSHAAHRSLWFIIGLVVAFLPAGILGFAFHSWIEKHWFTPATVAVALILGGIMILIVEHRRFHVSISHMDGIGISQAFWVGVAQCAALFPGISRSGATIIGGILIGMDRKLATEYSFFLALPTLIVATTYKIIKSRHLFSLDDLFALGLGLIVAFLVAWAVIAVFLAFVKRHTLNAFAYYRIGLGLLVFLLVR